MKIPWRHVNLIARETILAIFPKSEDRSTIERIFSDSHWHVEFVRTPLEAQTVLHTFAIRLLICDDRFPDGSSWKDVFRELQHMSSPPPMVVAGCRGDGALWSEVLNLGGYDLLMKPLDANEVLRTVNLACEFGARHHEPTGAHEGSPGLPDPPTTPMPPVTSHQHREFTGHDSHEKF